MSPRRIQQQRTRGWRKPEGAVAVHRNTRFGNPYRREDMPPGGDPAEDRASLVDLFREMIADPATREQARYPHPDHIRASLAGKDLLCWCRPEYPCHADVLLEIANTPDTKTSTEHTRDALHAARVGSGRLRA